MDSGLLALLGPGMTNEALTLPLQMFMVAREGRHDG